MGKILSGKSVCLVIFVMLANSSCHLPAPSDTPHSWLLLGSELVTRPSLTAGSAHSRATAAEQLVTLFRQEAALTSTSEPPDNKDQRPDLPRLPPLPTVSHLSAYAFIAAGTSPTIERYILAAQPQTPETPSLFTETDEFGLGLGLDMGLTEPELPLSGAVQWPLAVQSYCVCPDTTGLYETSLADARLDFTTGRFRLLADFTAAKAELRTAAMDINLDRSQLLNRQAQQAITELKFATHAPVRLNGNLDLFVSGRDAIHIGGQFSSAAPLGLSDILFVMQFAGESRLP